MKKWKEEEGEREFRGNSSYQRSKKKRDGKCPSKRKKKKGKGGEIMLNQLSVRVAITNDGLAEIARLIILPGIFDR